MNTDRDEKGRKIDYTGLQIVSGEGEGEGHALLYRGAPNLRQLEASLSVERCGGDLWSFARAADGTRYYL